MNKSFFLKHELECPCGCGRADMDDEFIKKLSAVRRDCGFAFLVNSGFRCPDHNEKIGGKVNSSHTKGLAVDIKIDDSKKRFLIIEKAINNGFRRIGIADNFIHLDDDPSLPQDVIWTYF